MSLGDRVVLAIAGRRRDHPLFGCPVARCNCRQNASVHIAIESIELVPASRRQRDIATAEIDSANLAIVRVADTEPRMPDWRKCCGDLKIDQVDKRCR